MTNLKSISVLWFACATISLSSCLTVDEQVAQLQQNATSSDPHTYSKYTQVTVSHLDLNIAVDFTKKQLKGYAEWTIDRKTPDADEIVLDSYKLNIDSILLDDNSKALYQLGKLDHILGTPLTIKLKPTTQKIKVYYNTGAEATALQWLTPQQTFDKAFPFLYTQGESIYTRSWIPCQDAPAVRFTYDATVTVPKELLAVMSASNTQTNNGTGVYQFSMQQKIPAYLIALAVGDLKFQAIADNIGVYAEPSQLPKCYKELSDLPKMMQAAEQLYGAYAWDRYDVLFLPSGFPFGGMENPRLTFATPTILTGDKSLVSLIAHELAHSWSGNLVTNATWNDFWLNESFTVYFERRIMEAVEGKDYAAMLWDLGLQDLQHSLAKYKKENLLPLTKLQLDLSQKDPDLGLTDFAYEKGAAMLLLIEHTVGRPALDSFIHTYFQAHKFTSMFTKDFDSYISKTLFSKYPKLRKEIKFDEWVYAEGVPDNCPKITNPRFDKIDPLASAFIANHYLERDSTALWSTMEWLHFLRAIQPKVSETQILTNLDQEFNLSQSTNAEIAMQWYVMCIEQDYQPALPYIERFLQHTGRMKFLEPIYEAMIKKGGNYSTLAHSLFKKYNNNYHPLAQKSVGQIIQ